MKEIVMKTLTMTIKAILVTSLVLLFAIATSVHASSFRQIPFEFEDYNDITLDWADSNKDDSNTGSTALGFSVTIGGAAYSYFDMCIDGYIELLTDACDIPTAYGCDRPTGCGWGRVDDLIYDEPNGADPNATYLLAAYGDFDSTYYGYYGYKLFSDRAVFYYDTETWQDAWADDPFERNNFEVILYDDGNVQWNFNSADYWLFDHDLFSGLYFGNTQTLLELTIYHIPEQKSYLYYGCDDWLTLDFNNDCFVDWADLGNFAHQWLQCAELNDPNCTEDQYTLTINIVGNGSVTKTPDQATYTYGTIVDVNAIADAGWTFSAWSGDLSGSNNPETIIMDGNKTVTATFTENQ
ncbi:MAG: hypothetical protein GTO35_13020 [Gammaproteobacteria bacterium]|nr:hypothetical protein [Gammaproteobacteria bacterium]